MNAPAEQRLEDRLQAALAAEDKHYQDVFGPPETWSPVIVERYVTDCHLARQRATDWAEAA